MPRPRSKKDVRAYRIGVGLFLVFLFVSLFVYAVAPSLYRTTYDNTAAVSGSATTTAPSTPLRLVTHVPTPDVVRGIYMTSCTASVPKLREDLVKLIDETELNAVVIDVKSFDGYLSFEPQDPDLKFATRGGCFVRDMQDFIDELHAHHIYVIGREASFQDKLMASHDPAIMVKERTSTSTIWRDHLGVSWVDASTRSYWKYLASIAVEAHDIGFDEINFDYIRFPADGDMKNIWYPISGERKRTDVIREYYEYLHDTLKPLGITISGDIFGMTTTNHDDLGIGQIIEYALANFDYVMPMVYPSHYSRGFFGMDDPNKYVYEVVKISMDHAVERALATTTDEEIPGARIGTSTPAAYAKQVYPIAKLRPWLQDNNYPVPYTPEMVRAQIQADYDAGLQSWALWNAGNKYTRSALRVATTTNP